MDKLRLNKNGFTLIEMLFVLLIICITSSLTLFQINQNESLKFNYLKEKLHLSQLDSLINHRQNTIEIFKTTLYINDEEYDLYPLECESIYFHYNEKGNISNACTIRCENKKKYEIRLQLGTGWMIYE
ncbi:MAG: prepilin-type N-terminal cleavage/methylation domain-containing protein [Traorella sp.]